MNLLDLLFPKTCFGCGKFGNYLCKDCVEEIKQSDLVCPFCERPNLGGAVHLVCKRKFGLEGLWSLGIYQGLLRKAIQKLKYKWVSEIAKELVDITLEYWVKNSPLLLEQIKKDHGKSWIVTSVPLHPTRQKWRGFNQSELLAKLFASKLGLEYENTLKRTRNTTPQMKLHASERKKNIRNAFSLLPDMNHELITNNVLLVDDVWTTGSTLKECCFVLKKARARTVWAVTIAR